MQRRGKQVGNLCFLEENLCLFCRQRSFRVLQIATRESEMEVQHEGV